MNARPVLEHSKSLRLCPSRMLGIRRYSRDTVDFLLCAVAGSVDAVAYLLCGQVFVANMTGRTVLLAISLLQGQYGGSGLRGGPVVGISCQRGRDATYWRGTLAND